MNYFDLHCDTAYAITHSHFMHHSLRTNELSVSLDGFDEYEKKAACFAFWSDNDKPESEVFDDYIEMYDYLAKEVEKNRDKALFCDDEKTLTSDDGRLKIIRTVEGARLIGTDLSKLEKLRVMGIRVLTLVWGGTCSVGGAHDTDEGLTDFGFRVVEECEKLGIIIDLSHSSDKLFFDVANVAKKPFIATHSNARAVCDHKRNVTDTELRTIISSGGVVGINLVKQHLSKALSEGEPDAETVYDTVTKHIFYLAEKGSPKNICLGLDFDGTQTLPVLNRTEQVKELATQLRARGMSDETVGDVMYNNAYRFFANNL